MLRDIAPKAKGSAVPRARKLRTEMSLPEVLLWQFLRSRPHGLKFRRQHAAGPYILDFFCSDARLAIEVDGECHARGDQRQLDERRDAYFLSVGILTQRIAATDVLANLGAVTTMILDAARSRLPLHHPAAPGGPPPRVELGED